MQRLTIALIAALLTATATAQQAPTQQCVYTQVTMPDGKAMTCVTCGSFTSCS